MYFGMGQDYDNLLPILVYLGYVAYENNRLLVIKKRLENINTNFPDVGTFHFTSYRVKCEYNNFYQSHVTNQIPNAVHKYTFGTKVFKQI